MNRLLPVLAAALLLSATACTDDPEPEADGTPPAGPAPSSTPSERDLTPAEYQTWISGVERDIRAKVDRAMAAKTLAGVDAARLALVATLTSHQPELGIVEPPGTATETHENVRSLIFRRSALRNMTKATAPAPENECGVAPPAAQRLYQAKNDLWLAINAEEPKEITADAKKEKLNFGAKLLPRRPVAPKATNHRLRNGTVVRRTGGRGPVSLQINNNDRFDVAVLTLGSSKGPKAMIYVRAGSSATLRGIAGRNGTFTVAFKTGKDWDERRRGFNRDCSFQTFEQTFSTGANWRISLAKTPLGNAPTKQTAPF